MIATEQLGTSAEYFSAAGLSQSGMKALSVSPLRYWYLFVNPEAPLIEPTLEMKLGTALHCAVLEPKQFDLRYAHECLIPDDSLVTIEDLRGWLRDKGITPKGTRKAEVIAQVMANGNPPIQDVLHEQHAVANMGKTVFAFEDWQRIAGCAAALMDEPLVKELLQTGDAEVPLFATDPDTGVILKGKLDWITPTATLDIKTFTQKRGKSIDRSVADAIFYEEYYRQAYFYHWLRKLNGHGDTDFVLAFVESEAPHEVRLKSLRPKFGGQPNLYWTRAMLECRGLVRTYREYMDHFGTGKPWKYAQDVKLLIDEDIPQMAY